MSTPTTAHPEASAGGSVVLEAEGVRKTYRMGRVPVRVLEDASIQVREGEWLAILGASGSGKSTLLHLLGGLDRPDRDGGVVKHRGRSVSSLRGAALNAYRNRDIGFVFQFYHLLPELTVLENSMLPCLVPRNRLSASLSLTAALVGTVIGAQLGWLFGDVALPAADDATTARIALVAATWAVVGAALGVLCYQGFRVIMDRVQMKGSPKARYARETLADFGLAHRLQHRPSQLSGGERQRTAIARALGNEPPILLADEPTGNLDANTGREILELLKTRHANGLTIVMVTHDPKVAAYADRVVRIEDGRVLEDAPTDPGPSDHGQSL